MSAIKKIWRSSAVVLVVRARYEEIAESVAPVMSQASGLPLIGFFVAFFVGYFRDYSALSPRSSYPEMNIENLAL
ncbi:hypothetical protein RJ40_01995 [Methanofollis aquaemaris]|uniref:Uncharacterized protein n=1 Tax=Methanofollis aquaemaris TaxID=126734 RepID=A0A8A3S2E3_9EURY|nr:hypothetical protein [Methanofollis aquaemaris]QSZ66355.1 hypothetical protein RJ40_01995 [Methanofollis aquaemaris]